MSSLTVDNSVIGLSYLLFDVIACHMEDQEVVTQVAHRHTFKKRSERVKLESHMYVMESAYSVSLLILTHYLSESCNLSAA